MQYQSATVLSTLTVSGLRWWDVDLRIQPCLKMIEFFVNLLLLMIAAVQQLTEQSTRLMPYRYNQDEKLNISGTWPSTVDTAQTLDVTAAAAAAVVVAVALVLLRRIYSVWRCAQLSERPGKSSLSTGHQRVRVASQPLQQPARRRHGRMSDRYNYVLRVRSDKPHRTVPVYQLYLDRRASLSSASVGRLRFLVGSSDIAAAAAAVNSCAPRSVKRSQIVVTFLARRSRSGGVKLMTFARARRQHTVQS